MTKKYLLKDYEIEALLRQSFYLERHDIDFMNGIIDGWIKKKLEDINDRRIE